MRKTISLFLLATSLTAQAELRLPAIIGDNMVLQQKQSNPIWGWDAPGTEVNLALGSQSKSAKADDKGKWTITLDPLPASAIPAVMTIQGTTKRELKNILVGEVWVCSGQSNMGFNLNSVWDAGLDIATAKYPQIRLISVPQVGTQELQDDFKGKWEECSPATAGDFTAVGYHYGRVLHEMLGVPVGLIDNAWGGSACEAWVRRDVLEKDARFKALIEKWKQTEATYSDAVHEQQMAEHKVKVDAWTVARKAAIKAGQPAPANLPRAPQNVLRGQHRPGNLYAGCLNPILGYGIKGAIWYQGESNASRAFEYSYLFPLMITHWRAEWKQGDFPFYWVQLADFKQEQAEPGESDWAELRESQTKSISKLANAGQCVITDLGEANDIHPKNKRDVAERLARWALARDYGVKLPYRSPELKEFKVEGGKALLTFDYALQGLRTIDVDEVKGFALCGADQKWVWAKASILGGSKKGSNQIEVSSPQVPQPVAVRYAWSDNPICNVFSAEGLPLTPFRTDDFPMITDPANPNGIEALAAKQAEAVKAAQQKRQEDLKKAKMQQGKTAPPKKAA
ncbi:MAG: sialate O-acetylesterase [Verrucomicrobia bacterium]|nr:sialate O-acetylesterase [Verrucomicrobiota bacterium]